MSRPFQQQCLAWWQLLRAGNVFTAASNVIAGFLIAQSGWEPVGPLLLLIATSMLLYLAGMVLNDVFDAELDAVERPERPIPSERISRTAGLFVGFTLQGLGILCACSTVRPLSHYLAAVVGCFLAVCVVTYDAGLKRTVFGPVTMALCRFLNVLLGASVAGHFSPAVWFFASLVALYTLGITYYARSENKDEKTSDHTAGVLLVSMALSGLFVLPFAWSERNSFVENLPIWGPCWLVVVCIIAGMSWSSRGDAQPKVFRRRVSAWLKGFILIDACVSYAVAGWVAGLLVAALLVPTWIASRFAPMT